MTWVYVFGVAVIVVLWVIGLELGVFHKMVGEQLAQILTRFKAGITNSAIYGNRSIGSMFPNN